MNLKRNNARAFTLIELMVVVAIMAIALTMSFPALSGAVHRAPLTKAVMDVMEGCRKARERAILTGSPAELRFLADGMIQVADSPEDQDFTASPDGQAAAPVIADAITPPRPSAPGFSATLPDTVAIELFEINFTDYMNTEGARIRFYPNGTSDELTLILRSEIGERRKITLEVVTALAGVEPL